jgi:hypothetical protein
MSDSKFINGIWIEEKTGKYGEYLQISISLDGLQALTDLPKSEKGYTVLFASRQKNDKKKFSCKPAGERQPTQSGETGRGNDDMPF